MPVSAPVSLSKIKAEFGGGNSFSQYVRNGPYVPTNGTTGNISTSVAGLRMSTFLNAAKTTTPPPPTTWQNAYASDAFYGGAGYSTATVSISVNGTVISSSIQNGPNVAFTWLPAGQSASNYQYRLSYNGGATWSGWTTITTNHIVANASVYGDGFYAASMDDYVLVQLGSGGVVLGGAVEFGANAFVEGRF